MALNDTNSRLRTYLLTTYSLPAPGDLPAMIVRNLAGRTGDYTSRMKALIADAVAANP
jgi:hypothetical protein